MSHEDLTCNHTSRDEVLHKHDFPDFDDLQNHPGRDNKLFETETVEPTILDHCFDCKDNLPNGFLPEGFSREVFLRSLDLVDRCNQSTLFVLGRPLSLEGVLGTHRWPELQKKWSAHDVTVFDYLSNDDLADFYKDGAVIIDCGGGKIHEVTVELLTTLKKVCKESTSEKKEYVVKGGVRTSHAFRITQVRNMPVVTVCKKLKPGSKHKDVREGWVSIFSSGCSHKDPPQFYRYKYGEQSLKARIDEDKCRRLSNRVSKRDPKEMRECLLIDVQSVCQESMSTHSPQLPKDAMTPSTRASDKDVTTPSSNPSPMRSLPLGLSCDESPTPRTPIQRQHAQPSTPFSAMSARSPEPSRNFFEYQPPPPFPSSVSSAS